jgi:hypothetical protein
MRPYLEKNPSQKKGIVEWLKVLALSSNPGSEKEKMQWVQCLEQLIKPFPVPFLQ